MDLRYSVPCLALVVLFLARDHSYTTVAHGAGPRRAGSIAACPGSPGARNRRRLRRDREARRFRRLAGHRVDILMYMARLPKPHKLDEWLAWEPAIAAVYRESPLPLSAEPTGDVDVRSSAARCPGNVAHGFGRQWAAA